MSDIDPNQSPTLDELAGRNAPFSARVADQKRKSIGDPDGFAQKKSGDFTDPMLHSHAVGPLLPIPGDDPFSTSLQIIVNPQAINQQAVNPQGASVMDINTSQPAGVPADGSAVLSQNVLASFFTLIISSGTLICCVLPAVMVSLGAGAALAGLVTAVPQLIWMSQHKGLVFGAAAISLLISGVLLWKGRSAPCPADPKLGRACMKLRRWSNGLWFGAVAMTALGATFAFVLPLFL